MKYLAYLAFLVFVQHAISDPTTLSTSTTSTTSTTTKPHATDCELSDSSKHEQKLLERLSQLKGKKFTWEDKEHKYFFSVCSKAENASLPNEAFIQVDKESNGKKQWVIGRLDDVDLEGTNEFVRLMYKNGDSYANACNKTERNAVIYLTCDSSKINPEFVMIEENNNRLDECAYIFQLKTKDICLKSNQTTTTAPTTKPATLTTSSTKAPDSTKAPESTSTSGTNSNSTSTLPSEKKSKLGVLSIILIALVALLAVYFIMGTLYMRFVNQATGWEQIPNFGFWNAIGEGSADLCNMICRCGNRRTEIHTYENINDHVSDDENLLNM
ncbi:cation-dependent mannose-6-phosphate receptor [Brachionus plicatilis]|uniref:Cation-dependent mannose-6-phosphate receptor n=1 Tax=Brachionus plicatilis TaxID=10195 RepID=A0A3M7RJL9_BRAPC|nr:cation-dependent mannose-6-phosphate receptor [Brachionus plicatilis]